VETLITVVVGIVAGLSWRRFADVHDLGAFTDIMLGITGAFAARWMQDVLHEIGVNLEPYGILLVLCGSALLPWSFHGLRRRQGARHQLQRPDIPQQDLQSSIALTDERAHSHKTHTPAA
jgi:uncharacterized membrane protein YeaQ/YmgE (transglycosylase-associated protein family)